MAADHGRTVGSYTLLNVIAAETDEEAMAMKDDFIEKRDDVAITEFLRASGKDVNRADYAKLGAATFTFMSIPYVVGSYQTVARHLDSLANGGVKGVCMTFPDFTTDVKMLIDHIMPLMESRSRT